MWPNAADVGAQFAAAGIDSAMGAGGPGVDGFGQWGGPGGDGLGNWGSYNTDGGMLWQGAAGDWGSMGSPAFGDFMALYPGARFDHGMLEIPFGPDSVSPAYLTLDAAGNVGADFTGHVKATGLDLEAGTTASPPNDRKVRWLRTSDGAVIANLAAFNLGGGSSLNLSAQGPGTDVGSTQIEGTRAANTSDFARVLAQAGFNGGGVSEVTANVSRDIGGPVETRGVRIIGSDGSSDYVVVESGRKRGNNSAESATFTTLTTLLDAAAGAIMRVSIPAGPARRVRVNARCISRTTSAFWGQVELRATLAPADLDGRTAAYAIHPIHNAFVWVPLAVMTDFRLAANTAYTCTMSLSPGAIAPNGLPTTSYYFGTEYLEINYMAIGQ